MGDRLFKITRPGDPEWIELVITKLPRITVTDETLEELEGNRGLYRGDVRIGIGEVYTDREYEEKRERILARPVSN